jgi:cell wall-associated NlpC family hydrolase
MLVNLVDKSRSFIGVPYVHQGRTRAGLDCIGLILAIGEELGKPVKQDYAYQQIPEPSILWKGLDDNFIRKPAHRLAPGDIMVFRIAVDPQHIAIYLGDDRMLHAYENVGQVVEHRYADVWKRRLLAVYSYE